MLFGSGDRYGYKSLNSVKPNNTGIDRRNVGLIFFPAFGKAGTTKKKGRAMPPTPRFMQVLKTKMIRDHFLLKRQLRDA